MLRFEGDRDFPQAPADLFARLTDARFLVECIPDVESVKEQQADSATLVLRPGFAFVRGTLDVVMRIVEASLPSARIHLDSKGIGSSAVVESSLTVADHAGGSRVHWVAEIKSLGGLLKMVPTGLIRGAAEKVINDAWSRIEEKLR